MRAFTVLIASAFTAGCGISNPMCTQSIEPAIGVFVVDSVTWAPIADSAFGAVHDGTYVDSLRPAAYDSTGTPVAFAAADERPGVYTVDVLRPGYRPWSQTDVQVTSDGCHVRTVLLTASMVHL